MTLPPPFFGAYLVGWYDTRTMHYFDASIYSEPCPTISPGPKTRYTQTCVIFQATGAPSYEVAKRRVLQQIDRMPALAWVKHAPSFRSMVRSGAEMKLR